MELSEPENIISRLILIIILTLINAFFASAEMAIVSLNKNKIKFLADDGNKKAILLLKLIKEPTKFLSTIQVGITLAGFFNSAYAAIGISGILANFFNNYNLPYSEQIAIIIVTIVLSYITLVFGELFPKRVALQKSESLAMFSVIPIMYVSKLTVPFVKLLSISTNILVRLFGLDIEDLDEKVSEEEIKSLIQVGQEHGVINETEKRMINSIFDFDDKLAYEIMTPRTEVYMINIDTPLEEYLDDLIKVRFSRIPVYEGDTDNIIGILYMKDFYIQSREDGFENIVIRNLLQPPYFIPETKRIDKLFKELQSANVHMAVLIDEYGGFSGIVSMEDLIEEIMGEIDDEYDQVNNKITRIDNNTFLVDGMISIDEFNNYFDLDIENIEYDTISGLLIHILGRIPEGTEEKNIEYKNLVFKIEKIKEKRIELIKVYIQNSG